MQKPLKTAAFILITTSPDRKDSIEGQVYTEICKLLNWDIVFANTDFTIKDLEKVTEILTEAYTERKGIKYNLAEYDMIVVLMAGHGNDNDEIQDKFKNEKRSQTYFFKQVSGLI